MSHRFARIAVGIGIAALVAGCAGAPELGPAARPLSRDAMMLLGKKGMKPEAPIFVRIFKEESELEVWKQRDDGHFYHFKTYPICTWSGDLGPKISQGDRQAPEGFYTIQKSQMNPNSGFHLAFNTGFPNAYDRSQGRTGSALMVHGKCKSAGCYAMTDALIEEIYALARDAFDGGQTSFEMHAYPFHMTDANMARHKDSKWLDFWRTLKEGYDYFEATRQPPSVLVCGRSYHVNARPIQNVAMRIDPAASCPALERAPATPFAPPGDQQMAERQIVAPGPKMRAIASIQDGATGSTGGDSIQGLLNGTLSSPGGGRQGTSLGFSAPGN
jgi:murein L,D-transpeptidase YafK